MNNLDNCADFRELYELYSLGLLDASEKERIDEHLAAGCEQCRASIEQALLQNAILSGTVTLVKPPAHLRQRVLAGFGEARPRRNWFWAFALTAAACFLAAIGLFLQNRELQTEMAQATRRNALELARVADVSRILQAPGTRLVTFGPGAAPHGSVFVHAKLGIVMVAGTLAPAPAGWNYETWIVPASGAPRAVEAFTPDANGSAITIIPGAVDPNSVKAVAVSLEPAGATLQKPTKVLFAAAI
jgi:anti-sigma-K factor RskA